jgi:hypothetical protein
MEGSGHGLVKGIIPACLEGLRKKQKKSVRISGLWADI